MIDQNVRMANVVVRIEDFEDGVFPGVCVVTGGDPAPVFRITARYRPGWPFVFCLLGPIGFVIAFVVLAGVNRDLTGGLPITEASVQRSRRARRNAAGVAVAAAALGLALAVSVGSLATEAGWFIGSIALMTLLAALYRWANPPGSVNARLARNLRTVTIRGAHPRFAETYEAQDRRRIERRHTDNALHGHF